MQTLTIHSQKLLAAGVLLATAVGSAHAALPPAATTAMTGLQSDASEFVTWAWGVAVVFFLGLLGIKMFKKAGNKAT